MKTKLEPSFLQAIVMVVGFKPDEVVRAQSALLMIGLRGQDFTAADLPGEIVGESIHLSGVVTGALITQGLIEVCGRIKSPNPSAKGRKVNLLRIKNREKVVTWLEANGIERTKIPTDQYTLPL